MEAAGELPRFPVGASNPQAIAEATQLCSGLLPLPLQGLSSGVGTPHCLVTQIPGRSVALLQSGAYDSSTALPAWVRVVSVPAQEPGTHRHPLHAGQ